MLIVIPGQANILSMAAVAVLNGSPIITGTVNFYLVAKDGDNAGKWYKGSDQSWSETEEIAGAGSHVANGHWDVSLPSGVWTSGVSYLAYLKESGALHIPTSEDVFAGIATAAEIAALNNLSAADVNAEVDSALSDYDPPTKTEMDSLQTHGDTTWPTATSVTVSDKTGFSLTQTFPTNFSALSISAGGVVAASGDWNTVTPDAAGVVATALGLLNNLSESDVQSAMTAQGYTTDRGALLDHLGGDNDLAGYFLDLSEWVTAKGAANTDYLVSHGDSTWATATSVTVSDKTGFSLVSTGLDAVTAWTCNITGNLVGTVSTVTTLTNLPAITAGWLTDAGISASALDGKGDWNTTTPPTAGEIDTELTSTHGAGGWTTGAGGEGTADWTEEQRAAILADLAAIQAKTDLLGSSTITVTAPVAETGEITLTAGDDYASADSRALVWTQEEYSGPDLTAATAQLALIAKSDWDHGELANETTLDATVEMDETTAVYTVELTAAETADLETAPPKETYNYVYELRVTLASGRRITVARGDVSVLPGVAT